LFIVKKPRAATRTELINKIKPTILRAVTDYLNNIEGENQGIRRTLQDAADVLRH